MTKPSIIPNWKYQKPTKGGYKGLKKLLKYVSFRENPEHRPMEMSERWADCGLSSDWREVYENAGKSYEAEKMLEVDRLNRDASVDIE